MILACPVLGPLAGLATMQATAHGRGFRHPQAFRCPVCYGSPRCLSASVPTLRHGEDALRLNATVPVESPPSPSCRRSRAVEDPDKQGRPTHPGTP
jgi:hypothetical protein